MLRRMNRKYTIAQYLERVEAFGRLMPGWAITTDLIVGFPGESEEDFRATLALVETSLFAQAYMFVYSSRRGTPAAHFEQVPADVATERFKRLAAAQDAACRRYHDCKIGTLVRALIQGPSKKDRTKLAAKTSDNVTVIAPMPSDYDASLYGQEPWIDVRVEAAFVWGCTGTMLGRASRADAAALPVQPPVLDLIAAR
jgi:tRNA-2-methylthio-N6-dimethylallyladenosine synthase